MKKKKLSIETRKILAKRGASPTEIHLYGVMMLKFEGAPFESGDLKKKYRRSDSTIKMHLKNMIEKGLVIRCSRYIYQARQFEPQKGK